MKTVISVILLNSLSICVIGQNPTKGHFLNEVPTMAEGIIKEIDENGDSIIEFNYSGDNLATHQSSKVYKKYKGNPYYGNKFYEGSITIDGSKPAKGMVGYNIVKGVVYYSPNSHTELIELRPSSFTLDSLIFIKNAKKRRTSKTEYYNVLVEGEPKLIVEHNGSFLDSKDLEQFIPGNNLNAKYQGSFQKHESYYIVINNKYSPVKPTRSFINSLGQYKTEAKYLILENQLDLKQTCDIVSLIKLLNK